MAGKTDAQRYWCRRPMGYAGTDLDRGQVFTPSGAPNDEKLERLGYMVRLDRSAQTYACAECGAEFAGLGERTGHGDKRHYRTPLNPFEEDQRADREERMLQQAAPLYLDKTAAALA